MHTFSLVRLDPDAGAFSEPLSEDPMPRAGKGGSTTSSISSGGAGDTAGGCASLGTMLSNPSGSHVAGNSVIIPSTPAYPMKGCLQICPTPHCHLIRSELVWLIACRKWHCSRQQ